MTFKRKDAFTLVILPMADTRSIYFGKKLISLNGHRFSMIEKFQHGRTTSTAIKPHFLNEQVTLSASVQDMGITVTKHE